MQGNAVLYYLRVATPQDGVCSDSFRSVPPSSSPLPRTLLLDLSLLDGSSNRVLQTQLEWVKTRRSVLVKGSPVAGRTARQTDMLYVKEVTVRRKCGSWMVRGARLAGRAFGWRGGAGLGAGLPAQQGEGCRMVRPRGACMADREARQDILGHAREVQLPNCNAALSSVWKQTVVMVRGTLASFKHSRTRKGETRRVCVCTRSTTGRS